MGQKVAFATTNWENKPNKPTGMTQAEWDAYSSSKFNGFPFPIHEKNTDGSDFELWNGLFYKGDLANPNLPLFNRSLPQSNSESAETPIDKLYGPGTNRPIGFTLNELIQIFWRVKRYNINISASSESTTLSLSGATGVTSDTLFASGESGEPPIPSITDSDEYAGRTEADIPITNYQGLTSWASMNGAPEAYSYIHSPQLNQSSLDDGAQMTFSVNGPSPSYASAYFNIGSSVIKPFGQDLYYPTIAVVFGIIGYEPPQPQQFTDSFTRFSSLHEAVTSYSDEPGDCGEDGGRYCKIVYGTRAGGNISFMGKDIPMFKIAQFDYWDAAYIPIGSVNGSIGSPARYWEYDDGNGNPIYDKFTGAELRDPVTGTPV